MIGVVSPAACSARGPAMAAAAQQRRESALLGGAVLGNTIEGNQASNSRVQDVQNCTTQTFYQDRISGYNVRYEYAGREYQTQMPYDPGPSIRVQVQVTPYRFRRRLSFTVGRPTGAGALEPLKNHAGDRDGGHSCTGSYLSRATRSRFVPSMRTSRVGPARLGACTLALVVHMREAGRQRVFAPLLHLPWLAGVMALPPAPSRS